MRNEKWEYGKAPYPIPSLPHRMFPCLPKAPRLPPRRPPAVPPAIPPVPPPSKGRPVKATAPASAAASPESNIKETIESILVAFILAFIFRAFVVEAFVIPTGSMAPTLMGAHMRFRCPDCGYPFDVNFNNGSSGSDDVQIPDYARTAPTLRP